MTQERRSNRRGVFCIGSGRLFRATRPATIKQDRPRLVFPLFHAPRLRAAEREAPPLPAAVACDASPAHKKLPLCRGAAARCRDSSYRSPLGSYRGFDNRERRDVASVRDHHRGPLAQRRGRALYRKEVAFTGNSVTSGVINPFQRLRFPPGHALPSSARAHNGDLLINKLRELPVASVRSRVHAIPAASSAKRV